MTLTRSLSTRRLLACTLAATVAFGVFGAPAYATKPAEKPATTAAKPATKKPAAGKDKKKSADAKSGTSKSGPSKPGPSASKSKDTKAAKPVASKPAQPAATKAAKPATATSAKAAKPAAAGATKSDDRPKLASAKSTVVAAPQSGYLSAPVTISPPKATLSPTPILATNSFSLVTPASASTLIPSGRDDAMSAPAAPTTRVAALPSAQLQVAESTSTPAADVALVKQSIDLTRRGKTTEATSVSRSIADPLARKLTEWAILRSEENDGGFDRLAAFTAENPSWPNATLLRRRAEGALWDERKSAATVTAFFRTQRPITAKGKFALARALLSQGDQSGAAQLARTAWREDTCSREVERVVMETFGDIFTRADHKARMDRRLYDDDTDAAMRMAQYLGGADLAIAKARIAVIDKSSNALALLDAVPGEARQDLGYIFSRAQWLRRNDKNAEAAKLMLSASRAAPGQHDLDEWWVERRVLARKLLDDGDHQSAYRIARDAVPPAKEVYRGEHEFTAGWIALRFLNDPRTAAQHFARVGAGTTHPTTLARGEYWQGRAAEAAGRNGEARAHYQAAAQYPTAYYGQIARARLGLGELHLRRPPEPTHRAALMNLEVVRATQLLYAVDARDLVISFVSDLAERAVDPGALVAMAEVAKKNDDARAMLLIGKGALARGVAMDVYAFPTNGIPAFRIVGPQVDKSVVYSIARQESAFNPKAVSRANALGLMQVLPGTGKLIAKKFGFPFDQKKMLSDPAYNAQMGAAELGDVLESYRGSYILSFVAYNAGRGRVKQWIEKYGDPRDPEVDPIDWVERIPFSETRNYVQRVLENMQVYRAQLGHSSRPTIEADLRRGQATN
jgi:soluble lytic murein transglycosylase